MSTQTQQREAPRTTDDRDDELLHYSVAGEPVALCGLWLGPPEEGVSHYDGQRCVVCEELASVFLSGRWKP